jgi:hypothetical protein
VIFVLKPFLYACGADAVLQGLRNNRTDIFHIDILGLKRFPYPASENEGYFSAGGFFVMGHQGDDFIGILFEGRGNGGDFGFKAERFQMIFHARRILPTAESHADAKTMGENETDADRFAMQKPPVISGGGFERVGESVTEIEQSAVTARLFAFIISDDVGFHTAGCFYGVDQ